MTGVRGVNAITANCEMPVYADHCESYGEQKICLNAHPGTADVTTFEDLNICSQLNNDRTYSKETPSRYDLRGC